MFFYSDLFDRLDRVDAENVMKDWFEPYWALASAVCKLDGGEGQKHKPIELGTYIHIFYHTCIMCHCICVCIEINVVFFPYCADGTIAALVAIEEIQAGSLIHLGILCDATESLGDDDVALALQNPYVVLFVQRFLERTRCLEGLTESQLNGCATLVHCVASNLDKGFLESVVESGFTRAEEIVERRRPAQAATMDDLQLSDSDGETPTVEKDAQVLLTVCIQLLLYPV